MEERLIDIPWYEGIYKVNNLWNVISYKFNRIRILKYLHNSKWYSYISIKQRHIAVHRLVAQAFLWLDISNSKIVVCHIDDNPLNNRLDNLYIWSQKDNIKDMIIKWRDRFNFNTNKPIGHLWKKWIKNHRSKIVYQFSKHWKLLRKWDSLSDVERELSINRSSISECCLFKRLTAWWFIWKY